MIFRPTEFSDGRKVALLLPILLWNLIFAIYAVWRISRHDSEFTDIRKLGKVDNQKEVPTEAHTLIIPQ